ncbi:MAG TPA: type II toxin-antitoxin system Phd/YefM family antitoxin [Pyrinomonadaceae bacterium]|jgi:prevent-host-death family protein
MKNIVPITDLQRQAGQIIGSLSETDEPVIVTQRGRAAAVIISAERYEEIEDDLKRLDELELLEMIAESKRAIAKGDTISHDEVKRKLKFKPE